MPTWRLPVWFLGPQWGPQLETKSPKRGTNMESKKRVCVHVGAGGQDISKWVPKRPQNWLKIDPKIDDFRHIFLPIPCLILFFGQADYCFFLVVKGNNNKKERWSKARHEKTRQEKPKARPDRKNRRRQVKTRQDKRRRDKTRQGKTRQGKTRQDQRTQVTTCLLYTSPSPRDA